MRLLNSLKCNASDLSDQVSEPVARFSEMLQTEWSSVRSTEQVFFLKKKLSGV